MAYTATKLITDAYHIAGILADGLQEVSGSDLSKGLDLLNDALAVNAIDGSLIPFYKLYEFDSEIGVQDYFVPNLIFPSTLTFNMEDVRFSMMQISRDNFNGSGRVDNINSLPFTWKSERELGGATISLYFKPDSDSYPMKLWGKFSLDNVALGDDLSTVFDRYYLVYLKYLLADFMCTYRGLPLQPSAAKKLEEIESALLGQNTIDFTTTKISLLQNNNNTVNWGYINTGHGFTPV